MLTPQEIKQLAKAVAVEIVTMQRQESIRHDANFDATDLQELKRRQHQLLMASRPKRSRKHA